MSQVKLIDPVESLQGKMSRKGETIFRCKHYRDANGKIIAQGAQEAYVNATLLHPSAEPTANSTPSSAQQSTTN